MMSPQSISTTLSPILKQTKQNFNFFLRSFFLLRVPCCCSYLHNLKVVTTPAFPSPNCSLYSLASALTLVLKLVWWKSLQLSNQWWTTSSVYPTWCLYWMLSSWRARLFDFGISWLCHPSVWWLFLVLLWEHASMGCCFCSVHNTQW